VTTFEEISEFQLSDEMGSSNERVYEVLKKQIADEVQGENEFDIEHFEIVSALSRKVFMGP
jgi:hypothetical protein